MTLIGTVGSTSLDQSNLVDTVSPTLMNAVSRVNSASKELVSRQPQRESPTLCERVSDFFGISDPFDIDLDEPWPPSKEDFAAQVNVFQMMTNSSPTQKKQSGATIEELDPVTEQPIRHKIQTETVSNIDESDDDATAQVSTDSPAINSSDDSEELPTEPLLKAQATVAFLRMNPVSHEIMMNKVVKQEEIAKLQKELEEKGFSGEQIAEHIETYKEAKLNAWLGAVWTAAFMFSTNEDSPTARDAAAEIAWIATSRAAGDLAGLPPSYLNENALDLEEPQASPPNTEALMTVDQHTMSSRGSGLPSWVTKAFKVAVFAGALYFLPGAAALNSTMAFNSSLANAGVYSTITGAFCGAEALNGTLATAGIYSTITGAFGGAGALNGTLATTGVYSAGTALGGAASCLNCAHSAFGAFGVSNAAANFATAFSWLSRGAAVAGGVRQLRNLYRMFRQGTLTRTAALQSAGEIGRSYYLATNDPTVWSMGLNYGLPAAGQILTAARRHTLPSIEPVATVLGVGASMAFEPVQVASRAEGLIQAAAESIGVSGVAAFILQQAANWVPQSVVATAQTLAQTVQNTSASVIQFAENVGTISREWANSTNIPGAQAAVDYVAAAAESLKAGGQAVIDLATEYPYLAAAVSVAAIAYTAYRTAHPAQIVADGAEGTIRTRERTVTNANGQPFKLYIDAAADLTDAEIDQIADTFNKEALSKVTTMVQKDEELLFTPVSDTEWEVKRPAKDTRPEVTERLSWAEDGTPQAEASVETMKTIAKLVKGARAKPLRESLSSLSEANRTNTIATVIASVGPAAFKNTGLHQPLNAVMGGLLANHEIRERMSQSKNKELKAIADQYTQSMNARDGAFVDLTPLYDHLKPSLLRRATAGSTVDLSDGTAAHDAHEYEKAILHLVEKNDPSGQVSAPIQKVGISLTDINVQTDLQTLFDTRMTIGFTDGKEWATTSGPNTRPITDKEAIVAIHLSRAAGVQHQERDVPLELTTAAQYYQRAARVTDDVTLQLNSFITTEGAAPNARQVSYERTIEEINGETRVFYWKKDPGENQGRAKKIDQAQFLEAAKKSEDLFYQPTTRKHRVGTPRFDTAHEPLIKSDANEILSFERGNIQNQEVEHTAATALTQDLLHVQALHDYVENSLNEANDQGHMTIAIPVPKGPENKGDEWPIGIMWFAIQKYLAENPGRFEKVKLVIPYDSKVTKDHLAEQVDKADSIIRDKGGIATCDLTPFMQGQEWENHSRQYLPLVTRILY